MKKSIQVATILFLFSPILAIAQSGEEIIAELNDVYESMDGLRGDFTQTMTSAFMDTPQQTAGTVSLQGDKYRIEAGDQTIITDGLSTWVYTESTGQLLINDYVEDETSFSINNFFLNFDEKYTVESVSSENMGGQPHHKLSLKPKAGDSFFTHVTIWVRKSDSLITQLVLLDVNETEMTFSLDAIQIDPGFSDDTFSFTPPEGTEVIDLRS